MPKAYVVESVKYFPVGEALLNAMKDSSFDPKASVLTEDSELSSQFGQSPERPAAIKEPVNVAEYGANRILMDVNAPRKSVLVVTDLFFPHWSAFVDGLPAKIYRVNGVFRGVLLNPGKHLVEMRYRNPAFHLGLRISVLTAMVVVVMMIGQAMWHRRGGRRGDAVNGGVSV